MLEKSWKKLESKIQITSRIPLLILSKRGAKASSVSHGVCSYPAFTLRGWIQT